LFGPQTIVIEKGKIIVVLLGRYTGQNQISDIMEFDKDAQEKCSHTCEPGRYLSLCFQCIWHFEAGGLKGGIFYSEPWTFM
jgi:hypothetical protein